MARQHASGRKRSGTLLAAARRRLAVERLEERRLLAITVDTHLDVVDLNDGVLSLREAIFAANTAGGADAIDFTPALTADGPVTILLTQGELVITEALTIDGPGSTLLSIDAHQQSRIFNISATTGGFSVKGLALENGRITGSQPATTHDFTSGGAIRSTSTGLFSLEDVQIRNSETTGNRTRGGAISANGTLSLVACNVVDNRTLGQEAAGGAIYATGNISVVASTIGENEMGSLGFGSAIYCLAKVTIESSLVAYNTTPAGGGPAVYAAAGAQITDSSICHNLGGGISTDMDILSNRHIEVVRSDVSFNIRHNSRTGGAGIYSMGTVTLRGSIVSGNQLLIDRGGGGIYGRMGVTAVDSLISNNSTSANGARGGGIRSGGVVTLTNTKVIGNWTSGRDANGGGIDCYELDARFGSEISRNYTVASGSAGGGVYAKTASCDGVVFDSNYTLGIGGKGGAMYADSLEVTNCDFRGNSTSGGSASGGAIFGANPSQSHTTSVINSRFSGNSTSGMLSYGGGIFNRLALTLEGVEFTKNSTTGSSAHGGAVHLVSGDSIFSNCLFSENSTAGGAATGGAVYSDADLSINATRVVGNRTTGQFAHGGGIRGDRIDVTDSLFDRNSTLGNSANGGGIFASEYVNLKQSTVSGNHTSGELSHGGGIATSELFVAHSTIVYNETSDIRSQGGGIFASTIFSNRFDITDSIIAQNSSQQGPDVKAVQFSPMLRNSLIGNASAGSPWSEGTSSSPDANGNLIGGPVHGAIDPLLGPLVNNGGVTWTHELLPGSPALNNGNPAAVAGASGVPEFDQRGWPWSRVVGGRIDMGAIEAQSNPLAGDYNFNGVVDAADFSVWRDTVGSANDLRADGSGAVAGTPDGVVDQFDYEFWKASFGNVLSGQGGSSFASSQLLAGEDQEDSETKFGERDSTIAVSIGGDRRTVILRLAMLRDATLGQADEGDIEGLMAWLAARPQASRDEDRGEGRLVNENQTNSESSHASDDVFASLSNDFWLF